MATRKTDPLWLRQASDLERVAKDNLFLVQTLMSRYRLDVLNQKARNAIKNHCDVLKDQAYTLLERATKIRKAVTKEELLAIQEQNE